MARRSSSLVSQRWRSRTFFCSSEKNNSIAALLLDAPTPAHRSWQPEVPERFDEPPRPELRPAVGVDHSPCRAACPHGVIPCCDSQRGLHPRVHRVPDDPAGIDVLHPAEIELALGRGVLGDVGQPQLVRRRGGEIPLHQIIVNRRPGSAVQAPVPGEHRSDAVIPAQAVKADNALTARIRMRTAIRRLWLHLNLTSDRWPRAVRIGPESSFTDSYPRNT